MFVPFLFVFMLICHLIYTEPAAANDQDEYLKILDQFESEAFEGDILKKFDTYLSGITSYSNEQYVNGLQDLYKLYLKFIIDLSSCQEKTDKRVSENHSEWLAEFVKKFGKKTIVNYGEAIKNHLFTLGLNMSKSQ